MPIVSSASTLDAHTQTGGGARYLVERHTDDLGLVHTVGPYLVPDGFDVAARLAARVTEMNVNFAEKEAREWTCATTAYFLRHQTKAELAARVWGALREAQRDGSELAKIKAQRICWRLYNRYSAGDFTVAELRASYNSFFGTSLTANQFNTQVVARMLAARDRYQAMLDEAEI